MSETQSKPLCGIVSETFSAARCDVRQLAPLTLAYIGDTVYDLYVRTKLVINTTCTAKNLHRQAAGQVCAAAQAKAAARLLPLLTEDEQAVFRRGRNAHMGSVPKHAAIADYRAATALEALVGYLYLSGQDERLNELMTAIFEQNEEG